MRTATNLIDNTSQDFRNTYTRWVREGRPTPEFYGVWYSWRLALVDGWGFDAAWRAISPEDVPITAAKPEAERRKGQPVCTGVLDYFPDALLAVAEVSKLGNDQHNPGEASVVSDRVNAHQLEVEKRKSQPVCTGCLDYFPDALLAVAEVSKLGNDQHNPGEPLHWARGKSMDQMDAAVRHIIDRKKSKFDTDGGRHLAKAAWRILAELQLDIEAEAKGQAPSAAQPE